MIEISFIIPVYNAVCYLEQCVQSIIDTKQGAIEIILVDDGSIDGSSELCEEIADTYSNITCIHQENSGVSSARNKGLSVACGEFICFVDADDYLKEDFCRVMLDKARQSEGDAIFSNWTLVYGKTETNKFPKMKEGCYKIEDIEDRIVDDGTLGGILFGSACGVLYKKSRIENLIFREDLKKNEDGLFNLVFFQKCNLIYYTEYSGYCYRQWKNEKKTFCPVDDFDRATTLIRETCASIRNIDVQIKRRNISVVFWNSILVRNSPENVIATSRKLKNYFNKTDFDNTYQYLCWKQIGLPKRILITMLKLHLFILFTFTMKHIVPLFENTISH